MKIGFDAKRAFENETGLGNYSRLIVELAAEEEHVPYLFSAKESPTVNWTPPENSKIIGPKYNMPFWRTMGMASQIKETPIDLYHGLSHELPFNIKKAGVPTVVTMHDCIFHHFPDSYTWIDQKIYDQKWQYAINHADKIIAISQSTADDLIEFYNAKAADISIIPLFAKDCFQANKNPEKVEATLLKYNLKDPFCLFVGNHHQRKNLDLLIQTYTHTDLDLPPVFIVGANNRLLKDFLYKHNLTEKIHIPEQRVPDEELSQLYTAATTLIYPSLYEGFGLPILEAMQCGTPVITCQNSSLKEVGGDAVIYTSPDSTDELAEHIHSLHEDDSLRKELREKGLKQAAQFSKENHKEKLFATYKKITG